MRGIRRERRGEMRLPPTGFELTRHAKHDVGGVVFNLGEKFMRRPTLIALLGAIAAAWPLAAPARQPVPPCGWIGVRVSPMTAAFADSLGMTEPYGAIFDRPERGSPAAHARIEAGDVITAINGVPLRDWTDFQTTISSMAPGTMIYLTTYRDGQLIERQLVLDPRKCRR